MRLGVDTNIVIDILENGHRLVDDRILGPEGPDAEEIDALVGLLQLWTCRDMRLVVPRIMVADRPTAKRDPGKDALRARQVEELRAALWHVLPNEVGKRGRLPHLDGFVANRDTRLLRHAIRDGCHVFLTRDRGISRKAARLRSYGIAVLRPSELVDLLAEGDDLTFLGAEGGVCDSHKWMHLEGLLALQRPRQVAQGMA